MRLRALVHRPSHTSDFFWWTDECSVRDHTPSLALSTRDIDNTSKCQLTAVAMPGTHPRRSVRLSSKLGPHVPYTARRRASSARPESVSHRRFSSELATFSERRTIRTNADRRFQDLQQIRQHSHLTTNTISLCQLCLVFLWQAVLGDEVRRASCNHGPDKDLNCSLMSSAQCQETKGHALDVASHRCFVSSDQHMHDGPSNCTVCKNTD